MNETFLISLSQSCNMFAPFTMTHLLLSFVLAHAVFNNDSTFVFSQEAVHLGLFLSTK